MTDTYWLHVGRRLERHRNTDKRSKLMSVERRRKNKERMKRSLTERRRKKTLGQDGKLIIKIKVFLKRNIVYAETILSAFS